MVRLVLVCYFFCSPSLMHTQPTVSPQVRTAVGILGVRQNTAGTSDMGVGLPDTDLHRAYARVSLVFGFPQIAREMARLRGATSHHLPWKTQEFHLINASALKTVRRRPPSRSTSITSEGSDCIATCTCSLHLAPTFRLVYSTAVTLRTPDDTHITDAPVYYW